MSVWRLHVHTREGGLGKYCLANNVIAMGWSFKELLNSSAPEEKDLREKVNGLNESWDDFVECAEANGYDFDCVLSLHDEVKPCDSVWLFVDDSYYVARISEQSHWRFSQEAREINAANQFTDIRWHYVGNKKDLIPPIIKNSFADDEKIFSRVLDYNAEGFSAWLLRALEDEQETIEPQNIWRILLRPGEDISKYCLANNVAAMGWSFKSLSEEDPELEKSVRNIKTWKDFLKCVEKYKYYKTLDGSLRRFHDEIKIGDVILMCSEDRYYYSVVTEKSQWRFNQDARNIDAANQLTDIYWKEIKNFSAIDTALYNQFHVVGKTFRRVYKNEIWNFILNSLKKN